ncbi:MAG TPA: tRNA (adenosine(37)-N6)-threonylcarbamoyltransferase complex ATPase subunit type 1 TsaE [Elusimicrobiota bacterium]|nr:tRNA (adenosine(37)-N6)-threonylcarbamoyltransferase complex ATPase subunit type 1 TsaE [Elusimicrobiota bacterium]
MKHKPQKEKKAGPKGMSPAASAGSSVPSSDWSVTTACERDTALLAEHLASLLEAGDCIGLTGDLGAGKTVFVKGLAQGLGLTDVVRSPSFVLIQTHVKGGGGRSGPNLHHVDLYRLNRAEIAVLGLEELLFHSEDCPSVTVIEWAEKARFLWPADLLSVRFSHEGPSNRRIDFSARGERARSLIQRIRKQDHSSPKSSERRQS